MQWFNPSEGVTDSVYFLSLVIFSYILSMDFRFWGFFCLFVFFPLLYQSSGDRKSKCRLLFRSIQPCFTTWDLFPGGTQHWAVRAKSCWAIMRHHVPVLKDQGQSFDGKKKICEDIFLATRSTGALIRQAKWVHYLTVCLCYLMWDHSWIILKQGGR